MNLVKLNAVFQNYVEGNSSQEAESLVALGFFQYAVQYQWLKDSDIAMLAGSDSMIKWLGPKR